MNKFVFGIMAVMIVGIVIVAFPEKVKNDDGGKQAIHQKEIVESDGIQCMDLLSEKDIYFKPDSALPDHPVVNDMTDAAKRSKESCLLRSAMVLRRNHLK